jgi:hypothetical protein
MPGKASANMHIRTARSAMVAMVLTTKSADKTVKCLRISTSRCPTHRERVMTTKDPHQDCCALRKSQAIAYALPLPLALGSDLKKA